MSLAHRRKGPREGDLRDPRDVLDDIEQEIERLKVLYEAYFRGVEKVPPARRLDGLERAFRNLERGRVLRTVHRFRLQGLKARLVTYKYYWQRILGQMEKGTYKRDVARAARRQAAIVAAEQAEAEEQAESAKPAGDAAEAEATHAPKKPRPAAAAGPAGLPEGLTAGEIRMLFKDLVAAKRAAGESVSGLTYGALVKKLAREVPKFRERHGCEDVRFEVSTSGGKVRLRARPGTG